MRLGEVWIDHGLNGSFWWGRGGEWIGLDGAGEDIEF